MPGKLSLRATCGICLVGLVLSSAASGGVRAQDAKAVAAERLARGHAIAVAQCGPCHAIGKRDPSPTRVNKNTAFRDLHKRFPIAMLVKALETGTIEGHDEMPAFDFSSSAMTDLLAYIDSLSPPNAPKYIGAAPQGQRQKR